MRSLIRQFETHSWPMPIGPIAVFSHEKSLMNTMTRRSAGNRDGPLIFHMRDGPPNVTGPQCGPVPSNIFAGGTGPPKTTGPPMDWLVDKKNLKIT